jgi:hypothetical protein
VICDDLMAHGGAFKLIPPDPSMLTWLYLIFTSDDYEIFVFDPDVIFTLFPAYMFMESDA